MSKKNRLHGLYVITDARLAAEQGLSTQVEAALEGGASIVQYRDKGKDRERKLDEAESLRRLTERHHALLIVNDDVELAHQCGADGVHLGRDDMDLATARHRLGTEAIIGISCYNRLELALRASRLGADYIAFGRFFSSRSKPQAVQAEAHLLRKAREQLALPLVAIGGITPENGRQLIEAGADMLAVIHAVFGQPDIRQACRRFQSLFTPEKETL
ncbi:MAG: thiamine phosphate synthase [Chromatiales bacterium]|jgi:thiamine-phosphate pyrophosphorylase